MDLDTHVTQLTSDGELLADAAESAGLDARVPSCPDWSVRDLVHHIGRVHRWAASFVADARTAPPTAGDTFAVPPGDDEVFAWFRDGHAHLVDVLSTAPADVACWTFLPAPTPLRFWARRQAHETAIHRVDAQFASGVTTPFDPSFAADGVDELLFGFSSRSGGRLVADPPVTLGLRATDTDDAWSITVGPDHKSATHACAGGADCVVTAPASELYLLLWNRRDPDGLDVEGDREVLRLWREGAQITWR